MKRVDLDEVSWQQLEAANYGLSMKGDDEVLENLGYVRSVDTLLSHVMSAAEAAVALDVDLRSPADIARANAEAYYTEEFFLSGVPDIDDEQREINERGLTLARTLLEERRAS
jgi:hypothetical protein